MAKNKLKKYSEVADFQNVIQPSFDDLKKDFSLKGSWAEQYFENNNPLILELGCGKGEYAVHLAEMNPDINFIGLDIKGARLWSGGQIALEKELANVAFIRSDIFRIDKLFAENEINEIWITFPDPQPKKKQIKKRLTNPRFLYKYKRFLKKDGVIHLKTDNVEFFDYTLEVVNELKCKLLTSTHSLYSNDVEEILNVKTYYEKKFLEQGLAICYLQFQLPSDLIQQSFG